MVSYTLELPLAKSLQVVSDDIGEGHPADYPAYSTSSHPSATTVTRTTTVLTSAAAATTSGGLLLDYVPARPVAVSTLDLNCPGRDGENFITQESDVFTISCSVGLENGDLGAMIMYTLDDCINACSWMNAYQDRTLCTRVEFHAILNYGGAVNLPNCWLMNATAQTTVKTKGDLEDLGLAASAIRVNSGQ